MATITPAKEMDPSTIPATAPLLRSPPPPLFMEGSRTVFQKICEFKSPFHFTDYYWNAYSVLTVGVRSLGSEVEEVIRAKYITPRYCEASKNCGDCLNLTSIKHGRFVILRKEEQKHSQPRTTFPWNWMYIKLILIQMNTWRYEILKLMQIRRELRYAGTPEPYSHTKRCCAKALICQSWHILKISLVWTNVRWTLQHWLLQIVIRCVFICIISSTDFADVLLICISTDGISSKPAYIIESHN